MEGRDDMEETTMQSSAPAFGTDALADTISLVEKHTMTFHAIFVPGWVEPSWASRWVTCADGTIDNFHEGN